MFMPSEKWLSLITSGIRLWAFLLLPNIGESQMLKFMMGVGTTGSLGMVLRHQISPDATHLIEVLQSLGVGDNQAIASDWKDFVIDVP